MKQPDTRTAMTIAKGLLSLGFILAAGFYGFSQLSEDEPQAPDAIEKSIEQELKPKP